VIFYLEEELNVNKPGTKSSSPSGKDGTDVSAPVEQEVSSPTAPTSLARRVGTLLLLGGRVFGQRVTDEEIL